MKRLGMLFLLSVLVVGCQDQRSATAPPGATGGIEAAVFDGAHGGNSYFYFLSPLVENPKRHNPKRHIVDLETFNPHLLPVVRVYALPGGGTDGCTFTTASVYGPVVARAEKGERGHYKVEWNTRASNLVSGTTYRICVFSSMLGSSMGQVLGFLDVEPVSGGMRIRKTNEIYKFKDDRKLPIKFRIEMGALCAEDALECTATSAVGATADTVVLPSGHAAVVIPSGAIGEHDTVTIVIAQQAPPPETPGQCLPGNLAQSQGCYHFSTVPANYLFLAPVRIEACVDVEHLSTDQVDRLLLYKNNSTDGLVALPRADNTEIDCSTFVLGAADLNAPTTLAGKVLRGAQRFFSDLVSPRALYAAAPMFATPKGLGGLAGSFSDVGGAVPDVPPGIVSWWPAEGSAFDLFGRSHGVLQGSATYGPGIFGKAFKLGVGDRVFVPPPAPLLDVLQNLTIDLWVKLDALGASNQRFVTIAPERAILRYDIGGPGQAMFHLRFGPRSGEWAEELRVDNALQAGCFQHVAGTYDGAAMRLYVNGNLVGTHPIAATLTPGQLDPMEISSFYEPMVGEIDEIRVFRRALTAAEIAAIYAAAGSAKCAPLPPQTVDAVTVTPAGAAISGVGSTQAFEAVAKDAQGHPISGKTFTWASLNPSVATITSSGVATAVASGQVTISATADGKTGYALLTVAIPAATPVNLWTPMGSGTTARLWGIWGSNGSSVFAGADGGGIYRFNGTTWTESCATCRGLGLWGTSSSDVFAVGASTIHHFDGANWSSTGISSGYLFGIWGASPRDVYAVGGPGVILHFDGTSWTPMASETSAELWAIWGSSPTNIWAVGRGGAIVHYDGTNWSSVPSPHRLDGSDIGDLYSMWGFSGSEIYAGGNASIVKYDGSTWSELPSGGSYGIWGSSGSDLYFVQGNWIRRPNGTSLESYEIPVGSNILRGLWGTPTSDIYAVGDGGTVMRGVRGATVTVTPANPALTAVGGTQQLTATARDASSNIVSGATFTWASSDASVATVSSTGLVTAVGSGTATITATAPGGAGGSTTVTVTIAPCPAAAAIDGFLCEPEWATATTFSFNANLPGGGTIPATLYVRNDATNLYLGVRFASTGSESSLTFEFDNDNDDVAENGDDVILLNPPNQFIDDFRTNLPPCGGGREPPPEAQCGFYDVDHGGSNDGAGAFHSNGSFSVYEMSHPLNSGDVGHDFSLAAGQTVGMFVMLQAASQPAIVTTIYPSFRRYLHITITP